MTAVDVDALAKLREAATTCGVADCGGSHLARGFCAKHYQRARKAGQFVPTRPSTSIEAYLRKHSVLTGNCWEWTGKRSPDGYGSGSYGGRQFFAHRESYLAFVGPIPEGYHLDHLCRNPACLRPDHLEAVPPYVNYMRGIGPSAMNKRKTHCKRGHEFTPENTRPVRTKYGRDGRACRACSNSDSRRYRQEARSA